MNTIEKVKSYNFDIKNITSKNRLDGISAFMRIKNGADFLYETVSSHIEFFDEIIIVYNQCTDDTENILNKLIKKYPNKLQVFHYLPKVYALASLEHIECDPKSDKSMANYSNFAIEKTNYKYITKLDDDHIAIKENITTVIDSIRKNGISKNEMICFSGINLIRDHNKHIKIPSFDPISGSGDIGFFEVSQSTFFKHDKRFERFNMTNRKYSFAGVLYWHCKYLKKGSGLKTITLKKNKNSRYHKKFNKFLSTNFFEFDDLASSLNKSLLEKMRFSLTKKHRFILERNKYIVKK